jgi:hypothetical protein
MHRARYSTAYCMAGALPLRYELPHATVGPICVRMSASIKVNQAGHQLTIIRQRAICIGRKEDDANCCNG